jgi:predicted alpha/beta superfamily hydrolase
MPSTVDEEVMAVSEPAPRAPGGQRRLHELKSVVFNNRRYLRIWLPPGYDDAENRGRRYPVLYLNDGQNLFESATAFNGVEWKVGESAERLIEGKKVPPMIVVGVDNAQENRIREYVPYRSSEPHMRAVAGQRYPDFLLKEVVPYVRKRYRIASGADNTGLGGSSLGGYVVLYTAIVRPRVFGRLLVESPSLSIASRRLLRASERFRRWPQRIFLGVGTQETGDEQRDHATVEDVRSLAQMLLRSGVTEDRLKVNVDQGAPHSETAWARRFPDALEFLYGNR